MTLLTKCIIACAILTSLIIASIIVVANKPTQGAAIGGDSIIIFGASAIVLIWAALGILSLFLHNHKTIAYIGAGLIVVAILYLLIKFNVIF